MVFIAECNLEEKCNKVELLTDFQNFSDSLVDSDEWGSNIFSMSLAFTKEDKCEIHIVLEESFDTEEEISYVLVQLMELRGVKSIIGEYDDNF